VTQSARHTAFSKEPRWAYGLFAGVLAVCILLAAPGIASGRESLQEQMKNFVEQPDKETIPLLPEPRERLKLLVSQQEALAVRLTAVRREREAKEAEAAELMRRMYGMLPPLWTMEVAGNSERATGAWEADQRKVWLGAGCNETQRGLIKLKRTKDEYRKICEQEARLTAEARLLAARAEAIRAALSSENAP